MPTGSPDETLRRAYAVGEDYERGLTCDARERGAHFTPPDVAEMLVDAALGAWSGVGRPTFCDPSCGGGVFLVAAAEALRRRGAAPADVIEHSIVGIDLDEGAAAATRVALEVWAEGHGITGTTPRISVGDALDGDHPLSARVDIVVGNPPFQNQLGSATARTPADRARLTARFGDAASGYVDIAALFQLLALDMVGTGGVVVLIEPRSFLVARDAEAVRDAVLRRAALRAVWLPGERVFEAGVDVCATVLEVGVEARPTEVWGGRDGSGRYGSVASDELVGAPTWSPVWAEAHGVPAVPGPRPGASTVGDVATATAGFRDQFYGLIPHLRRRRPPTGAGRVVTTGMIDVAQLRWGRRQVRIGGEAWTEPWLDRRGLEAADERLGRWVADLAIPKVLVATQTRVIEAAADCDGDTVPLTPVIAVAPTGSVGVRRLEAALTAPVASAWALRRYGGAALSSGALKLAARQVLTVPLPTDRDRWDVAVGLMEAPRGDEDAWRRAGAALDASWGVADDAVLDWWLERSRRSRADSLH